MTLLHQIDPVALALGPLKIHWYGLMYLLGFLVAWYLGRSRIRAGRLPGVDENGFGDLMFYGMLGVVLGGRLGYVLFYGFNDLLAGMTLRPEEVLFDAAAPHAWLDRASVSDEHGRLALRGQIGGTAVELLEQVTRR